MIKDRECLKDTETKDSTTKLNNYFETLVDTPRRQVEERQTIETLINEEALQFANFLRNEKNIGFRELELGYTLVWMKNYWF